MLSSILVSALIAQWTEQIRPKDEMRVQFLPGAQSIKRQLFYFALHIEIIWGTIRIMTREELKRQVRQLREKGKTYSEIMTGLKISIPKSTLSDWCKNVKLPAWYEEKIGKLNRKSFSKARKIAWVSNKKKREDFLRSVEKEASKIITQLDEANLKIILAMLYLGEGAKWKGHSGLMLGSSDSDIILLYMALLERCFGIKSYEMKCRICYRADQNIRKLEDFWSKITGIPLNNFYKTKPDPRTIGKETKNKGYKGVCVLTCKGANIQLELERIAILLLKRIKGL